jgi:hypothetical protein
MVQQSGWQGQCTRRAKPGQAERTRQLLVGGPSHLAILIAEFERDVMI